MPRDQRNIDVTALANRLAVVHRLEHRQPPRVLLHLPRQRIQIPCPLMPAQCLPAGRALRAAATAASTSAASPLRNFGKRMPGRWIVGQSKYSPARRPRPGSIDVIPKPAPMPLQPRQPLPSDPPARLRTPWCRTFPLCSQRLHPLGTTVLPCIQAKIEGLTG